MHSLSSSGRAQATKFWEHVALSLMAAYSCPAWPCSHLLHGGCDPKHGYGTGYKPRRKHLLPQVELRCFPKMLQIWRCLAIHRGLLPVA